MNRRLRRILVVLAVIAGVLVAAWAALRSPDMSVTALRAKYTSPASQFVSLAPGEVIHLRDEGLRDGFPVVLLHGSNASVQTWEPWVERLKDRYRVITFDFPGHGLSSPVASRDYTTAAYVGVTEKIVARLGLTRFALGGNSMGGGVAWSYAHKHPDQVAALILVDAAGQPDRRGGKLPIGFRIALTPVVRDIVKDITPRSMIEQSLHQTVSVQSVVTPAMVDRYWELLHYPGNRQATLDRFASYPTQPHGPDTALDLPAAIIWGRDDRLIPVASAAWFSARLPNARVTILDNVGHIPMEEAPDRALAPVLALLQALSPAATAP